MAITPGLREGDVIRSKALAPGSAPAGVALELHELRKRAVEPGALVPAKPKRVRPAG